jgi:hypothetical protein
MRKIGIALLAAAALAGVGGCKKKNDMMAKMTEFKDSMCKCADKKDADCAKKVTDDMSKWAAQNADKNSEATAKPSEDEARVTQQFTECATKAMTAAAPAAPAAGGDMAGSAAGGGGMAGSSAAPPAGGGSAAAGSAH